MRLLALLSLLALVGCDRAELNVPAPQLVVVAPDLGVVQLNSDLTLRLAPPPFSGPLTVRINGDLVEFNTTEGLFVLDVKLSRGLNRLLVEVTDDTDNTDRDTIYAVYLPIREAGVTGLSAAAERADAASAPLSVTQAVIAGGSGASGQALASFTLVQTSGDAFVQNTLSIQDARTGHTATAVDGGVMLTGGTTTESPTSATDFVTQAELITLGDEPSQSVEVVGGINRTRHTTRALTLDNVTYLYLYGGIVPSGSVLVPSGTVDVYEYRPDGATPLLVRLSPPGGSGGFTILSDHLQLVTEPASATVLGLTATDAVSFDFDWSLPGTATFPFSLRASPAAGSVQPRTRAAAVDLGGGLSLIVGGRGEDGGALSSMEIYAALADQSFQVPPSIQLRTPRYDHTATILPGRRIVIGGGRIDGGTPISAFESFQL